MCGRGGGGRGRGRGRGAVPPSVASAGYNFGNGSSSSIGSSAQNNAFSVKNEPAPKFPDILLPDPPKFEDLSDFSKLSAEYSDRLDSKMRTSSFFRPIKSTQNKIDRYSDKYLSHIASAADRRERLNTINTDLSFFPEELHVVYAADRKLSSTSSSMAGAKRSVSFKETLSHLDAIAQKEETAGDDGEDKPKKEGGEDDQDDDLEVDFEDEEFEDDTDYNLSYFDNGEDNGGDYDEGGGNDEAVF